MIILLAVLFILGNLLVALGVMPNITILALAIINIVGWVLAILVGGIPVSWPWARTPNS
jgi:hypothetical protein